MAIPKDLWAVDTPTMIFHATDEKDAVRQWMLVVRGEAGIPLDLRVEKFDPSTVEVESVLPSGIRLVKDKPKN